MEVGMNHRDRTVPRDLVEIRDNYAWATEENRIQTPRHERRVGTGQPSLSGTQRLDDIGDIG